MILSGCRVGGRGGAREARIYPGRPPLNLIRSVVSFFRSFVKGLKATGYSNGSINFKKVSFFRVPSILWATLPCLSMITVVGTTATLP